MYKMLKTFYGFVAKKRLMFFMLLFIIIVSSISKNTIPYFYKLFINNITEKNYSIVLYILIAYVGIRFFSLASDVLSSMVGDVILKESSADARSAIFRYVQNLDFAFHTDKSTGSLISAFKRGDSAFFNLYHHLHYRILDIMVGFFVMLYFFTEINPIIAVSAVISFFIMLILAKFIVTKNVRARNIFNDQEDKVSAVITDNLIGYETVKLFAKEDWEYRRLNRFFTTWKKRLWDYGMTFRFFDISLGTVINLSIFAILAFSINLYKKDSLQVGDIVLIVGFIDSFYPKVFDLVWSFREIAKNFADMQKYFGLLDFEIQVKDPQKPVRIKKVEGDIEFNNIGFSYKEGKKNAIRNLNLKVKKGESIALVGRSGSGKTTLVKLLMRFYDTDSGIISIDGINIKDMTKTGLRALMGVVPQEPILFNNTISYNIGYGKERAITQEIVRAAKIANIDSFIKSLPKGYQTNVGERGIKLSGGQKQRLAIARMILSDPDIIIFDEATSHLDSESETLIQDAFWKVARGKTTFVIAHRLSTVMKANKIIVMDNGKIVEIGTHSELLKNKASLYSHFWFLQTKKHKEQEAVFA